jgi:hypothetical protein
MIEGEKRPDPVVPGPGTYIVDHRSLTPPKYSFRPRTTYWQEWRAVVENPGPGTYKAEHNISKDGNYFLSNLPNSKAPVISPATSKRFGDPDPKKNPGPGAYSPKCELNGKGDYYLSRFRSSQCRTFTRSRRFSEANKESPGPGTYHSTSAFDYVEDRSLSPDSKFVTTSSFKVPSLKKL